MNDLKRDESNQLLSGVLAGVSKKYNIDLGLLRIIYATCTMLIGGFPGIGIYLIAALILPAEDSSLQ